MPSRLPPGLRPYWPLAKRAVLQITRRMAPLTSTLSRSAGRARLPAAAVRTSGHLLAELGGDQQIVVPAHVIRRPEAKGHPSGHWVFEDERTVLVPAATVSVLPHGRVVGGGLGAIIASDNTLLFDLSPYFGAQVPREHMIFFRRRLDDPVKIDASVGVLEARGSSNYFHFLLDVLPRLKLLEGSGQDVDAYYVPYELPFQRELLQALHVDGDAVIDSTRIRHVAASRLIVPSIPGPDLEIPGWTVGFLRERLLPSGKPKTDRRLYITRGRAAHTRRIVNECDVRALLEARGFESIDPGELSVGQQIEIFRSAEAIVAPHGAALSNVTFCSPGARVLELFAPDYVNGCYWALATHVPGVTYRYLLGEGRRPKAGTHPLGVASDIMVDLEKLEAAVSRR